MNMEPQLDNDRKKIVNTEDQNEPVNPGDRIDEDTVSSPLEPAKEEKKPPAAGTGDVKKNEPGRDRIEGDERSRRCAGLDAPGGRRGGPRARVPAQAARH